MAKELPSHPPEAPDEGASDECTKNLRDIAITKLKSIPCLDFDRELEVNLKRICYEALLKHLPNDGVCHLAKRIIADIDNVGPNAITGAIDKKLLNLVYALPPRIQLEYARNIGSYQSIMTSIVQGPFFEDEESFIDLPNFMQSTKPYRNTAFLRNVDIRDRHRCVLTGLASQFAKDSGLLPARGQGIMIVGCLYGAQIIPWSLGNSSCKLSLDDKWKTLSNYFPSLRNFNAERVEDVANGITLDAHLWYDFVCFKCSLEKIPGAENKYRWVAFRDASGRGRQYQNRHGEVVFAKWESEVESLLPPEPVFLDFHFRMAKIYDQISERTSKEPKLNSFSGWTISRFDAMPGLWSDTEAGYVWYLSHHRQFFIFCDLRGHGQEYCLRALQVMISFKLNMSLQSSFDPTLSSVLSLPY